jgi:hypothetical protein
LLAPFGFMRHLGIREFATGHGWFVSFSISWLAILPITAVAARIIVALHLEQRLTRKTSHYAWWFLAPVKDLFAAAVWAGAFLGNSVTWRGVRYRVHKGGKLIRI